MNEMQPLARARQSGPRPKRSFMLADLTFHPSHPLQWWFIHGSFRHQPSQGYRHDSDALSGEFMLSLFRCQLPKKIGPGKETGYMSLTAFLPEGSDKQVSACNISENLFEHYKDVLLQDGPDGARGKAIDPAQKRFFEAVAREMEKNGPFAPTHIRPMVSSSQTPFQINWHDLTIRQLGDDLDIHMKVPGSNGHCAFTLTPLLEALDEPAFQFEKSGLETAYLVCPRMQLNGMAGEHAIVGEAWFEQQSLTRDWFAGSQSRTAQVLSYGWHWFAIGLDDGRDLALFDIIRPADADHKTEHEMEQVDCASFLFQPDQKPQHLSQLIVEPIEIWQSPHSLACYPIKCRVLLPELDAELIIQADCDDQEVPVFGSQSAIWQGKGTVKGHIGGKAVSGRARMELLGYADLIGASNLLDRLTKRTDAAIAKFLPRRFNQNSLTSFTGPLRWQCDSDALSDMISDPCWEILDRGGKHWRPLYGLMLMQAFGADFTPYEDLLTILPELIHNGALIIDDVEDHSHIRRGGPGIHVKYGEDTAINAGNCLYFMPLMLLIDHPNLSIEKRERLFAILTKTFVLAHFGQAQDLVWSHRSTEQIWTAILEPKTAELILQGYAHKTAAEIVSIAKLVSVLLDLPVDTTTILSSFSEGFGVAFQIVDDVNNFSQNPAWSKEMGEDLIAGKPTYVICRAIQAMAPADQATMLKLMTEQDMRDDPEQIEAGLALVRNSGMLEECRRQAFEMLESEWARLERVLPSSLAKILLKLMCDKLIGHLSQHGSGYR